MYLAPTTFENTTFPRLETSPDLLEVYIRAQDAGGSTYVAWQWHDDPVGETIADHVYVLDATTWAPGGEVLTSALIASDGAPLKAALTEGPFASLQGERQMARDLAEVAMPREFWEQLHRARSGGFQVRVRITPSQRLASVPWELLLSPVSDKRLLELATIVYEVPYTVHFYRGVMPPDRDDQAAAPLFTVDVESGMTNGGSVLTQAGRDLLAHHLGVDLKVRPTTTRGDLSEQLKQGPSRWVYVGHVSAGGEPGLAAIHLKDLALANPLATGDEAKPWFGFARESEGGHDNHKPLTARDLHLGTRSPLAPRYAETHRFPAPLDTEGAEIWPMPRRVALVACASGADHAASEVFGLATAALASGAEWVLATRWILPTDYAFHLHTNLGEDSLPLARLVLAVNAAQAAPDPVGAIRDWQLERLAAWEATGDLLESPLLWGSLMTYWMPDRPDLLSPELKAERGVE